MGVAWRYVSHEEDAAALANKAYLKILNGLEAFLEQHPHDKFAFWAKRIAINAVIDDFRSTQKHRTLSEPTDFTDPIHDTSGTDWNEAEANLGVEELQYMLGQLDEIRNKVFNLYAIDGYKHREIAEILSIPEGTSKWHLTHARKELQAMVIRAMNYSNTEQS